MRYSTVCRALLLLLGAACILWLSRSSALAQQKQQSPGVMSTPKVNLDAKGTSVPKSKQPNFTLWADPLTPPAAAMLCVHGLGLNSDAYRNFATRMSRRGVVTYALDVRGFGSFMASNGDAPLDFNGTLADIKEMLKLIHEEHPNLSVFLLGESMGGAIALRAASMYPDLIQGLISAVPAGDRFDQKKQDLKVALKGLQGPWRKFNIGSSIVGQATKDKKLALVWESDPLNRGDLSPMQLLQFQRFMNENIEAAKTIKSIPVLMVQGTLDRLVRPEGTWEIFSALGNDDKALIVFPSEHLIFEYGRAKLDALAAKSAQVAANWIYEHVPQGQHIPAAYTAIQSMLVADGKASRDGNGFAITPDASSPAMQQSMDLYNRGNYRQAIAGLQKLIPAEPANSRALLWLSMAYENMGQPDKAFQEAMTCRDRATNDEQRTRANQLLLYVYQDPRNQPNLSQEKAPEICNNKPTVCIFDAQWSRAGDMVENLVTKAESAFGKSIQLKRINLQDPANAQLAQKFKIGPVPTFVFLRPDGTVQACQFGHLEVQNFVQSVKCLLN